MSVLLQDLRYAVRLLIKQPLFASVAILTLALGIGANTAIFSVIDTALLSPLPFPQSDRLVRIWSSAPERGKAMEQIVTSFPRYEAIRDGQDVFEDIAASTEGGLTLTDRGEPAQTDVGYVSTDFFQTLGVGLAPGRAFLPAEDQPGGAKVTVVSQTFWQKHLGGNPDLLGQSLTLDGAAYTVVGVLPKKLPFPFDRIDLFVPRVFDINGIPAALIRQGGGFLNVTARLKPGVTLGRAREQVQVLAARYRQAFPGHVDGAMGVKVIPFQEEIIGESRPLFYTLAGAVGCVLLIACVNVANLILARLAGRRKEIAVRAALGASQGRLLRQFLTESVLLAALAGAAGLLLAWWSVDLVHGLGPEVIPRAAEVHLSVGTLLFTLGVSLLTGALLGVGPALQAARGNAGEALQEAGTRGSVGSARQGRARAALLAAQVALSLVLLAGTALLLTSLWRLQRVQAGFNPEGVLTTNLGLSTARYPQPAQQGDFYTRLTERLDALPGVRGSTATTAVPLGGNLGVMFYAIIGQPIPGVDKRPSALYDAVSPGFFRTLEIPLLRGRTFNERDRADSPPVMIINDTMARRLFPDRDAVGQKLLCSVMNPTPTEIVGVAGDVRSVNLASPAQEQMFFPMLQRPQQFMTVMVRAASPSQAAGLASLVRAAVHEVDPGRRSTSFGR